MTTVDNLVNAMCKHEWLWRCPTEIFYLLQSTNFLSYIVLHSLKMVLKQSWIIATFSKVKVFVFFATLKKIINNA